MQQMMKGRVKSDEDARDHGKVDETKYRLSILLWVNAFPLNHSSSSNAYSPKHCPCQA
jgi:hypothetical protein